ncbi:hypothetical protein [Lacticaseibacillus suibinensis]|uniref:hypothetical protein n=1 Tax=Lacticaseibacillus suibinensis TaxID=2486011 RepID=UPI0013DDD718|nr:hypothetical protein [Lacticaseibacillus suibinensis]
MKIEKVKQGLEFVMVVLAIAMIAVGSWFFWYGSPLKAYFLMLCANLMLTLLVLVGREA